VDDNPGPDIASSEPPSAAGVPVNFDDRYELLIGQFRQACEAENVPLAVAIVVDPKIKQGPIVFTHGHRYDVAKLLTSLLRQLKNTIDEELTA
jgi:hypothetical protein